MNELEVKPTEPLVEDRPHDEGHYDKCTQENSGTDGNNRYQDRGVSPRQLRHGPKNPAIDGRQHCQKTADATP